MKQSINVWMEDIEPGLAARISSAAAALQSRFTFEFPRPDSGNIPVLVLAPRSHGHWVRVDRNRGVTVAVGGIEGVCRYLKIEPALYVLAGALIGLAQWRSLLLNPLLQSEDLHTAEEGIPCLLANPRIQDVALLLERGALSWSSREFYKCLGVEEELAAIKRVLDAIAAQAHPDP